MFYKISLSPDDGQWVVRVPAIPEVHSWAPTKEAARAQALDAVLSGMQMLVLAKTAIPLPAATRPRGDAVDISATVAAKIVLHNAMLAQGVGKYRLAKQLRWHLPQVDRLVDFRYASKLEQIEKALAVLGQRLVVQAVAA